MAFTAPCKKFVKINLRPFILSSPRVSFNASPGKVLRNLLAHIF